MKLVSTLFMISLAIFLISCGGGGNVSPPGDNLQLITVYPTRGLVTTEAGGTDSFTVVLDFKPEADVTIGIYCNDPTEGIADTLSLTFTSDNWDIPQKVTVTGVDDVLYDGNQVCKIVTDPAVSSDSNFSGLDADDVYFTNVDDKSPGITVNPTSGLATTESGGTDSFVVVLNTSPSYDVTIGLSSSDTTEGTVDPSSLIFTSDNWDIPQNVTVTGVDDGVDDGNQAYTVVTAPASSTDWDYSGINPADVSVTNTDDDDPPTAPPSGLSATAVSSNQINLSWTDNSTNEDGFKIERKQGQDGSYAQIDMVGADITAYNNTGLSIIANTIYYYRIRAYNAFGDSIYSNEASVTQKVMAFDAQAYDYFGYSVSISGDYAIVGADGEDAGGSNAGAAYIFHRTGTNSWDEGVKIVASDAEAGDCFGGHSVAISGDYAIVGADGEDAGGTNAGAAYIFY